MTTRERELNEDNMAEVEGEWGNEKVVMMPTREELTQKLQEASVLGGNLQSDRFFNRFIESVAGSEQAGMGLVMAWELSMYNTLVEIRPKIQAPIRAIMGLSFNSVIDLVTPDPNVAARAKKFRKQILEAESESL